MASQHSVVKIEVQCFEAVQCRRIDDRIVLEVLVVLKITWVLTQDNEAVGIQGTRLQFFEEAGFSSRTNRENDLVQVGLSLTSTVVAGVTHEGIVISRYALTHHEWATRHLRVQVL